ncbi:MAG: hypothetical protein VR68_08625 [Peptococcaceae bacterium BRH_c4a]|nr:MAG: hypothetical protein VR68_08625 [Peptococcaceae bacterium BRH_c4a]
MTASLATQSTMVAASLPTCTAISLNTLTLSPTATPFSPLAVSAGRSIASLPGATEPRTAFRLPKSEAVCPWRNTSS